MNRALALTLLLAAGCSQNVKQDACEAMLKQGQANVTTLAVMKEAQTTAIKDGYSGVTQALNRNGDKIDDLVKALNRSREAVIIEHRPSLYLENR